MDHPHVRAGFLLFERLVFEREMQSRYHRVAVMPEAVKLEPAVRLGAECRPTMSLNLELAGMPVGLAPMVRCRSGALPVLKYWQRYRADARHWRRATLRLPARSDDRRVRSCQPPCGRGVTIPAILVEEHPGMIGQTLTHDRIVPPCTPDVTISRCLKGLFDALHVKN